MNEKEIAKDLLIIGFGLILYGMFIAMVQEASDILPECKIYHESHGICEEWVEKEPGKSVIQG